MRRPDVPAELDDLDGGQSSPRGNQQPTDIRAQMPGLSGWCARLTAHIGVDAVRAMVRTSVALRAAVNVGDRDAAVVIAARPTGSIWWSEAGFELGVSDPEFAAFLRIAVDQLPSHLEREAARLAREEARRSRRVA